MDRHGMPPFSQTAAFAGTVLYIIDGLTMCLSTVPILSDPSLLVGHAFLWWCNAACCFQKVVGSQVEGRGGDASMQFSLFRKSFDLKWQVTEATISHRFEKSRMNGSGEMFLVDKGVGRAGSIEWNGTAPCFHNYGRTVQRRSWTRCAVQKKRLEYIDRRGPQPARIHGVPDKIAAVEPA